MANNVTINAWKQHKHMITKHAVDTKDKAKQTFTCNNCEESFDTSSELHTHIANKHSVEDVQETQTSLTLSNEHGSNFVFSDSMLNEFMDKNLLIGFWGTGEAKAAGQCS